MSVKVLSAIQAVIRDEAIARWYEYMKDPEFAVAWDRDLARLHNSDDAPRVWVSYGGGVVRVCTGDYNSGKSEHIMRKDAEGRWSLVR